MAEIMIQNLGNKIVTIVPASKTLLNHFQDHHIDLLHSCGGKGKCTTCKVRIVEGENNLGPMTQPESSYRNLGALRVHERLSCQAVVTGSVTVMVPDENKLPHLLYSS